MFVTDTDLIALFHHVLVITSCPIYFTFGMIDHQNKTNDFAKESLQISEKYMKFNCTDAVFKSQCMQCHRIIFYLKLQLQIIKNLECRYNTLFPFTICNTLNLIEILLRMSNHLAVLEVSLTGHIHITISRAIQFDFMFPQKYSRLKKDFNRFM